VEKEGTEIFEKQGGEYDALSLAALGPGEGLFEERAEGGQRSNVPFARKASSLLSNLEIQWEVEIAQNGKRVVYRTSDDVFPEHSGISEGMSNPEKEEVGSDNRVHFHGKDAA